MCGDLDLDGILCDEYNTMLFILQHKMNIKLIQEK